MWSQGESSGEHMGRGYNSKVKRVGGWRGVNEEWKRLEVAEHGSHAADAGIVDARVR